MGTIKFILNVISWGMALAYLGTLPEMTTFFKSQAVTAHSKGLMSLGNLTRNLETGRKRH